jgi:probable rRNA maturation factor
MRRATTSRTLRVHVTDRQGEVALTRGEVTALARAAAPAEWRGGAVSVVLVDGAEMTDLNGRFTGRSGDTDVLAFDLNGPGEGVVGEVIVNATRAIREARVRGVPAREELALYIVHGLTHLQGFDDHSAADRERMYAREETVLSSAGWRYVRHAARRPSKGGGVT